MTKELMRTHMLKMMSWVADMMMKMITCHQYTLTRKPLQIDEGTVFEGAEDILLFSQLKLGLSMGNPLWLMCLDALIAQRQI
jgi:hypothetical protein